MLDRQGYIRFHNRAVAALIVNPLEPVARALSWQVNQQFEQALRRTTRASLTGERHTEYLELHQQPIMRRLLLTIQALDAQAALHADPTVAIYIAGLRPCSTAPEKALSSFFALTPAEMRIAWAYARGYNSREIADKFAIARTTVNFHKRNIFQKTNTNRQADLMTLLGSLPMGA